MSLLPTVRCLSLPLILASLQPSIAAQPPSIEGVAPYFGVYFGTFDDGQGRWGMAVSRDGLGHFDLIGRFSATGAVIRSYRYAADVSDGGLLSGGTPDINGRIVDGSVTGDAQLRYSGLTPPGEKHVFKGELDRQQGPGAPYAGYWEWYDGRPDFLLTYVNAIVGPSGKTLVILKTPSLGDEDGMTTIDADGRFALTLSGGTRVAARIDLATSRLEATVMREDALAPLPGRAINLSTLASTDANTWAARGFTIAGGTGKRLLFRAVGSPLAALLGEGNYLANPLIEIWHGAERVAANDDWNANDPELRAAIARVGALPLSPGSKDAAFIATLPPGNYTMTVRPTEQGESGTVLSEIFDLDPDSGSFLNLTVQAKTGPGSPGFISGFVIAGDRPRSVLIRAVGPKLSSLIPGYPDAMADPQLEVRAARGGLVAANDNWSSPDGRLLAAARVAGTFPLDAGSKDAALLMTLEPGAYTATVRSANGAGGTVLLEIYDSEGPPPLTKARLVVDAFSVTMSPAYGDVISYVPRVHLIETGGVSAATVVNVSFDLGLAAGGIQLWAPGKTVPAGGNRELVDISGGESDFDMYSRAVTESASITIYYRDSNGAYDTISASTRVTR